ncbi:MAG: hypothetical protein RIC80_02940 [Cyclobacteriaceae bacterium]
MRLDYIPDINNFGDCVVRLYDFGKSEALQFKDAISVTLLAKQQPLDLNQLAYIQADNCVVVLELGTEDLGMVTQDDHHFTCTLTLESYQKMVNLITPFCDKDGTSHQMLYDVDSLTDFLFSPAGTSMITDAET